MKDLETRIVQEAIKYVEENYVKMKMWDAGLVGEIGAEHGTVMSAITEEVLKAFKCSAHWMKSEMESSLPKTPEALRSRLVLVAMEDSHKIAQPLLRDVYSASRGELARLLSDSYLSGTENRDVIEYWKTVGRREVIEWMELVGVESENLDDGVARNWKLRAEQTRKHFGLSPDEENNK
jgi:hypothetical protein